MKSWMGVRISSRSVPCFMKWQRDALRSPGHTAAIVHDAILNRAPIPIASLNLSLPPTLGGIIDKALEKERSQAAIPKCSRHSERLAAIEGRFKFGGVAYNGGEN